MGLKNNLEVVNFCNQLRFKPYDKIKRMKLKFDIEQLGKDLIKQRETVSKSHRVIGKEMKVPHATLFRIENGHQLDLNVSTLVKICNWTGIRPEIYFKSVRN